jgi:hypothetical protein
MKATATLDRDALEPACRADFSGNFSRKIFGGRARLFGRLIFLFREFFLVSKIRGSARVRALLHLANRGRCNRYPVARADTAAPAHCPYEPHWR